MKEIQLTQGYIAQVSDKDFKRVNQHKWYPLVVRRKDGTILNVYATRNVRRTDGTWTKQYLHRFILGVTDPKVKVDHAPDHSGLNCQRNNLRIATHAENLRNQRVRVDNSSGVKGVYWNKQVKKWHAQIMLNGKNKHLGFFISLADAKQVHDAAAKKYHGAFAYTNTQMAQEAA